MKSLIIIFLLGTAFCLPTDVQAQSQNKSDLTHQWLSVGLSSLAYKGDLGNNFSKWTCGLGVGLQFNTHKKWSGGLHFLVGKISGQDVSPEFSAEPGNGRTPNAYFSTSFASVHYQLLWNIYLGPRFRFFAGQGIGLMRYNPQNEIGTSFASLPNTRASNESYGNLTILAPTSLGLAWKFKNNFGVNYRLSILNTATDYLDNISQFGTKKGSDNVLTHQFALLIPVHL